MVLKYFKKGESSSLKYFKVKIFHTHKLWLSYNFDSGS